MLVSQKKESVISKSEDCPPRQSDEESCLEKDSGKLGGISLRNALQPSIAFSESELKV